MAHFYGTVDGKARTTASRLGSKNSGLMVTCNGWESGVRVEANYHENDDMDEFIVASNGGSGMGTGCGTFAIITKEEVIIRYAPRKEMTLDEIAAMVAENAELKKKVERYEPAAKLIADVMEKAA